VSQSTAGTYTYTLNCLESNGTHISSSFQLIVSGSGAVAPTAIIAANPTSITLGHSATLTWSSANATACTAVNAWSGARATSGTFVVTPTAVGTSTYRLTCSGATGTTPASATATVLVNAASTAPTVTIAVSPTSIEVGATATLTWSSTNAASCVAGDAWSGTQSTAGNLTVTPSAAGSATYMLMCTGTGGRASASATLAVSAAPSITVLSGKAGGGGGLGIGTLLGLGLLAVLRSARNYSRLTTRSLLGIALLALFGVLLQAAPAAAQDAQSTLEFRWQQPYVGVRLGSGTYSETGGSFNADLVSAGDAVSSGTIARHEFSGVAYVGVPFYQSLALEFGYADLGTYPVRITTAAANVTQVAESAVQRLAPAGRGLTLNLALPLNFNPWFAIEPRLGVLAYDSRQEVFTPVGRVSQNRAGAGADGGLSLLVHANRQFDLGAGVDCFGTNHACNVLLLSADIEFHFGR
jgi:PKD repeat protein